MGSDRYTESRMLAEDNFWPARALLVEAKAVLAGSAEPMAKELIAKIDALLQRTDRR